jgi:hypothetical protein
MDENIRFTWRLYHHTEYIPNKIKMAITISTNINIPKNPLGGNVTLETFKHALINGGDVIVGNNKRIDMMEYLMTMASKDFIRTLIQYLGFTNIGNDNATIYDLLWYLSKSYNDPFKTGLTREEIAYISGLSTDKLLEILGPRYVDGATDKASLLFAIISGRKLPISHQTVTAERYQEVAQYPPEGVFRLITKYYPFGEAVTKIDYRQEKMPYGRYFKLMRFAKTTMESIIGMVNENNVDQLISQYGIVLPIIDHERTLDEKIFDFTQQIFQYDKVLIRSTNIELPPPPYYKLKSEYWSDGERSRILVQYTTKELLDAYPGVSVNWQDRNDIIRSINRIVDSGPEWTVMHTDCKNDNSITLDGDPYGTVNKNNPEDPTLSFGYPDYYECYQVSELERFFTRTDQPLFKFLVPDYNPRNVGIDPTTGEPYRDSFKVKEINNLVYVLRELREEHPSKLIDSLIEAIDNGFEKLQEYNERTEKLSEKYNAMNPDQQYLIKLFVAWIFLYGMWMRFWKGPGYLWPTAKIELRQKKEWDDAERCEPTDRDEHIFIQNSILSGLKEAYEKDPQVKEWIETIPVIEYNFTTLQVAISNKSLIEHLDGFLLGEKCMGFGGNEFFSVGYYIAKHVLRVPDFDQFIAEMLPPLLDMERQVVTAQLAGIKNPNINPDVQRRVKVLTERRDELNQPLKPPNKFKLANVGPNIHINN